MRALLSTTGGMMLALIAAFSINAIFSPIASASDEGDDDGPFTERSIQGTWGWSGDGVLTADETGQAVPTVGLGTTYFDGRGACSVTSSVNINGTPYGPVTSTACTYFVNPDGTGHSVATFSEPPFVGEAPVIFVIVGRSKEIRFIQNNQFVVTFIAKKI